MNTNCYEELKTAQKSYEQNSRQRLLEYYEQAGPDYHDWSKAYNMHFGYYRAGNESI